MHRMTDIDRHDLEACNDVFDWITEHSDDLSTEQAVEMLEAIRDTHSALRTAEAMLLSRVLGGIEQPILVGSVAYSKKPKIVLRPRLGKILQAVIDTAVEPDHETGEQPHPREAADRAVTLMADLYVAPSSLPKTGGLKKVSLRLGDVTMEERNGWELKRTEIE